MKKIVFALVAFVMAFGMASAPASASTFLYSRSTDVSWGAAGVSAFAVTGNSAGQFTGRFMGYVDDQATDGRCVFIQTRNPNTVDFDDWVNRASSCGPVVRFDFRTSRLTITEWRLSRVPSYSTLR